MESTHCDVKKRTHKRESSYSNPAEVELTMKRYRIIGVRGTSPGCGKDTVVDMIIKHLQSKGVETCVSKFATPLRKVVEIITGVPVSITETVEGKNITISSVPPLTIEKIKQILEITRDLFRKDSKHVDEVLIELNSTLSAIPENSTIGVYLQRIGGFFRNRDTYVWIEATTAALDEKFINIIGDVRFPNEQEAIKCRDGIIILVKSNRPLNPTLMAGRSINDASERALDGIEADYTIENDGTLQDLERKVIELLSKTSPDVNRELERERHDRFILNASLEQLFRSIPDNVKQLEPFIQMKAELEEKMTKDNDTIRAHLLKLTEDIDSKRERLPNEEFDNRVHKPECAQQ